MIDATPAASSRPSVDDIASALDRARLSQCKLDDLEWAAILNALRQCGGNRTRAAELLGISTRKIQRWLKRKENPRA